MTLTNRCVLPEHRLLSTSGHTPRPSTFCNHGTNVPMSDPPAPQEVKRLQAQHEAAAALGRSLASQLQGLSEDLASARTRISVLQTEVATQQAELDTLRQTNATLKVRTASCSLYGDFPDLPQGQPFS